MFALAINIKSVKGDQQESLYMSNLHVWYVWQNMTSEGWGEAAFVVQNTGGMDVVIQSITARSQPSSWSNVYYWTTDTATISALSPTTTQPTGASISALINGTYPQTLNQAGGVVTLKSGYTLVVYINHPGSIGQNDVGTPVDVTVFTANAQWTQETNVQGVQQTSPLSVTILPTPVVLDVGQFELFLATVSGGTGPYSYQWYLNGVAVSGATKSTLKYTTNSKGYYTVYVKVTDSTGASVNSNIANVTVNSALSVTVFPVYDSIELGQLIVPVIFSNVSGGTAPYMYQWYFNSTKISGATDPTWLFTLLSAGSYNVYVTVTDSSWVTSTSNAAQIIVIPALNVTISPSSRLISLGDSVPFTSTVTGGQPTHQYQWYLNGAPVPAATNPTWTFTPINTGTYNIYLNVTDRWIIGPSASSNIAQIIVTTQSVGGVSASVNTFSFLTLWLGTVLLLAVAVLLKGIIVKKKRR